MKYAPEGLKNFTTKIYEKSPYLVILYENILALSSERHARLKEVIELWTETVQECRTLSTVSQD